MFENDAWRIYKSFLVFIYYKCCICVDLQVTIQYFVWNFLKLFWIVLIYTRCISMTYSTSYCHLTNLWIQGM
jgi:hypothetical protein